MLKEYMWIVLVNIFDRGKDWGWRMVGEVNIENLVSFKLELVFFGIWFVWFL